MSGAATANALRVRGGRPLGLGQRSGITTEDPAGLGQGVPSWLGSEGPAWWPYYHDEHDVLVLVVVTTPAGGSGGC